MDDWGAHRSSLTPAGDFTRRGFVVTGLAAGFALAVMPVSAQTITTDTNGLIAGEVKIPVSDGAIPGYRAMPASGASFAAVLVVQEIFGVHEHIRDICRRLAKLGYFAAAPALYVREGDISTMSDIQEILDQVVSKVPDAQVASDLDATVKWMAGTGAADVGRLGIAGFCWGGRQVWLYAAHNPALKAGVAWYGPLSGPTNGLRPVQPIELAANIAVPVLGLYGGANTGIPASDIEKIRADLKAGGKGSEIIVYPDTPHGFNADYRPSYRPAQAKDAWKKMQDWFKSHGVA